MCLWTELTSLTTFALKLKTCTVIRQLRTPTANYGATSVSRRPVLSVRRRIINTPTAAALAAATSTTTTTTTTSLPTPTPTTLFTDAAAVTQIGELQTTSKYNRIRSRPVITTTTAAAAAAQTTITTTTTLPTTTTILATQSLPTKVIITNNKNHLSSKLKTKFTSINAAEPVTTTTTTSSSSSLATFASDNTISQKQNNAKSPVSVALRRKFHPRRLITTTASSAGATDESATEPPRTQNPLFKRRFSLTYTISATTTSTTPRSRLNEDLALQTSTALYPEPEDATDQVAKSSIHTSRFNHNAAAAAEEDNEEVSAIKVLPKVQTTLKSKLKTSAATAVGHDDEDADGGIGEAITRRMDNTAGDYGAGTAVTTTTTAPAPAIPSRRASAASSAANKRRPQKANASTSATPNANSSTTRATRQRHRYVRVEPLDRLNQHAASSAKRNGQRGYQTNFDYDYYDEGEQTPRRQVGGSNNNSNGSRKSKKEQQLKVILHGRGIIECLDQGNFPHPLSCRKFISCAKFETGGVVGWEYTCPKGLRYDPASGMCTWANGIDCRD